MRKDKTMNIGVDGINFQMRLSPSHSTTGIRERLITDSGLDFGEYFTDNGFLNINVCMPKAIRKTNKVPFNSNDFSSLPEIYNTIINHINWDYEPLNDIDVKRMEVNITFNTGSDEMSHNILRLLNICLSETKNIIYANPSMKCKYKKENESLIVRVERSGRMWYTIKCYNKSRELKDKGNEQTQPGLLRIEFILSDRLLKRLLNNKIKIKEVLQPDSLKIIFSGFKRIFIEEIYEKYIDTSIHEIGYYLYDEYMRLGKRVADVIAINRELIVDVEVLRIMFKLFYTNAKQPDTSAQRIEKLKKYELPYGVLNMIREIKRSLEDN